MPLCCDEKRGDSLLGKLLANVAEHESEPTGVSGWRSSVYPTRTVVFWPEVGGVQVSGVVGPGQLQGLGAATAEVAKVAKAAAKMVKKCMVMLTMLGEERWLGRVPAMRG